MPRRHPQAADLHRPRRVGDHRDDLALKLLAAVRERIDRAARVEQRSLRCRPVQRHCGQPVAVALGPRGSTLEPDPVAQQQLREPVPAAHQINADRLTGTDQVTQRFLLIARNPDCVKLAGHQQPGEQLRVATIGLHAVPARARDLARRRDHTLHATLRELPREPVPCRAGLIRNARRPRQPRAEARRPNGITTHRERLQLPGLSIEDRRDDLRRVHVQADLASSLRHGWFLQYAVVDRPRGYQPRGKNVTPQTAWGNRPLLHRRPDRRPIHIV
jgi:hypothetical protein